MKESTKMFWFATVLVSTMIQCLYLIVIILLDIDLSLCKMLLGAAIIEFIVVLFNIKRLL